MKTYKQTIDKPRLIISYDDDPINPRDWSGIGKFITSEEDRWSPDQDEHVESIVDETQHGAKNCDEHIALIQKELETEFVKVRAIFPITRHEHGRINYGIGERHGFDDSNCGFYIIMNDENSEGVKEKDFERMVNDEMDAYNHYINGDMLRFQLFDKDGDDILCESGHNGLDSIQKSLPEEWANENMETYMEW